MIVLTEQIEIPASMTDSQLFSDGGIMEEAVGPLG